MIPEYQLILGDCLEEMGQIQDGSIDMILADLPYGTTACKWDVVIPFEPLWKHYKRVIKRNGAVVLFGSEPFSSFLRLSNFEWYKYDWVWNKVKPANYPNAKKMPLIINESVCVFSFAGASNGSKIEMVYNPIMTKRDTPRKATINKGLHNAKNPKYHHLRNREVSEVIYDTRYPQSILTFSNADQTQKLHPTQKPVALLEYLIRTYTNEGEMVLDNTCGSGSTLEVAMRTKRRSIGIEKDEGYFNIAKARLARVAAELRGEYVPKPTKKNNPDISEEINLF